MSDTPSKPTLQDALRGLAYNLGHRSSGFGGLVVSSEETAMIREAVFAIDAQAKTIAALEAQLACAIDYLSAERCPTGKQCCRETEDEVNRWMRGQSTEDEKAKCRRCWQPYLEAKA